jgi:hypothetical protein
VLAGELVDLGGAVRGAASMLSVAGGRAKMYAVSDYGGGTLVTGGVLEVGEDGALGVGPVQLVKGKLVVSRGDRRLGNAVTVQGGAVIDLAGNGLAVGSLGGGGAVVNSGTSAAELRVAGTLAPGDGVGTLSASGVGVVLEGSAKTEVQLGAGGGDRLAASGVVVLGGSELRLLFSGAAPALGQSWDVVSGGSVLGRFAEVTGISASNGLLLATTYLSDRVRVTAALAGDVDLNRVVDAEDFARLYANFGRAGAGWAEGDLNGDGVVSFADFQVLERGFGLSGTAAPPEWDQEIAAAMAEAPEPSCIAIVVIALIIGRRRGR